MSTPADLLIAEDDPDDLMLLMRALAVVAPGLGCASVRDGVALGAFLDEAIVPPRVVLLDLNMPRMDGREFLAHWRGRPAVSGAPAFIVLTTSAEAADRARVLAEGASGYFIKPSSFSALTEMMQAVVQQWLPEARAT
jgi:CheY-like chemotaxis protein